MTWTPLFEEPGCRTPGRVEKITLDLQVTIAKYCPNELEIRLSNAGQNPAIVDRQLLSKFLANKTLQTLKKSLFLDLAKRLSIAP